jgi:hypothetical protein
LANGNIRQVVFAGDTPENNFSCFEINGVPVAAPAKRPIRTFPLRVMDGVVDADVSVAG